MVSRYSAYGFRYSEVKWWLQLIWHGGNMLVRTCIICGTQIRIKKFHSDKGWGKYCGKKCQYEGQKKGRLVSCAFCGKEIYRAPSGLKKSISKKYFCSFKCHCSWENINNRKAENAPNWKTGKTVYRELLKRRDKPRICSKCGHKDERILVVHHIDSDRSNNSISNLEWLCCNCHYLVHSGY